MAFSQQLKTIVISFNFLAAKKVGSTLRGQAFKAMPKVSPMFLACWLGGTCFGRVNSWGSCQWAGECWEDILAAPRRMRILFWQSTSKQLVCLQDISFRRAQLSSAQIDSVMIQLGSRFGFVWLSAGANTWQGKNADFILCATLSHDNQTDVGDNVRAYTQQKEHRDRTKSPCKQGLS